MVKFALNLQAELVGVSNLSPKEEEAFYYMFEVECGSCHDIHENPIGICRSEVHDIPGSKGEANLIWTCKNCKRTSTISIVSRFHPYTNSQSQQRLLELECRGCELVKFVPDGEWVAKGEANGTQFTEIELEDDWYDYDENAGSEVSISDMQWTISKA
ncbi:DUF866 domain-containing protein [Schizosaccharomyces octosporus yFS286]|uniref:DUF866 domain-containing protein n=1 Tax=Schizosaccharomyces octosporus (strain yFS286) TaxID=483514 RepID=S9R286_SCHOY|nr:DUF866 domain-containing protein [Schizosaccharomyces octosporus yFS286]EPX72500.1 DUF866 domain-containing protein [Schizosaccharomyces octosporus yFS286]